MEDAAPLSRRCRICMRAFLHRPKPGTVRKRGAGLCGRVLGGAILCASCGSQPPVEEPRPGEVPSYSRVFVIHGDGDYHYQDTDGGKHRADEAVLAEARRIASRNPNAEVFIFHQKPRGKLLFLMPRKNGQAYYYRNGRLLEEEAYWRDKGITRFEPEIAIFEELTTTRSHPAATMFFYFGHEIPEFDGAGYDRSYPERSFTVPELVCALHRMRGEADKVDVVVLGTCYSGSPYTIGWLAPYSRYIVASPESLERSYFDLSPLENLAGPWDPREFSVNFARNAFDRLDSDIQTGVCVAVYDAEAVQGYVDSIDATYSQALSSLNGRSRDTVKRCDCAGTAEYALPGMQDGVEVLYRAARFGRAKDTPSHSGWSCWSAKPGE